MQLKYNLQSFIAVIKKLTTKEKTEETYMATKTFDFLYIATVC